MTTQAKRYVRSLVSMLRVEDLGRSLTFYVDGLGFEIAERLEEDGRPVWAYVRAGDAELMLSEQPGEVDVRPRCGAILYLYPHDLAAARERILDAGYQISPLRTTEYGMLEWDVLDPDGYELWLGHATDRQAK